MTQEHTAIEVTPEEMRASTNSAAGQTGVDEGLVEDVAWAMAVKIAYRHGINSKPDDWMSDARREEAREAIKVCLKALSRLSPAAELVEALKPFAAHADALEAGYTLPLSNGVTMPFVTLGECRSARAAYKAAADEITRLRAAVEAERERCARVALDLYDPRKNNGAREWDEWSYAAAQVAAAIRAHDRQYKD